jgi:hypothetical protein
MQLGDPYEKPRGLARCSDRTLVHLSVDPLLLAVILFILTFGGILDQVILLIAVILCLGVKLLAENAKMRRRMLWRPILEPLEISEITHVQRTRESKPDKVTTKVKVTFAGDNAEYDISDTPAADIAIGMHVLGDVKEGDWRVRNLTRVEVPAPA